MHIHQRRRSKVRTYVRSNCANMVGAEVDDEPPSKRVMVPICRTEKKMVQRKLIFPPPPLDTPLPRRRFKQLYYSGTTERQWNDWRWQIANRVHTPAQLQRFLKLSRPELMAVASLQTKLPLSITPYYMSLLVGQGIDYPLRKTVVPVIDEFMKMPEENDDPLGEENHSPIPGLVHRYPDRILFLTLDFCSTYCRYCTRSRVVGHGRLFFNRQRLEKALDYIRNTPTIRDVLLSGGDPLTLADSRLDWLLTRLRGIKHVEIIRIGTKVPAVLPQRITPQLVKMLRRHHPLWMSLHFTHPDECTTEAYRACRRLANAGIPLGSQTVLLKGVNDQVATLRALMHHLLQMRVRPYYLYQCDPISGSAHFRTPVEKGLEIIGGLRGHTSGYAVPTYVIDAPGGGGKIPLTPDYFKGRDGDNIILKNYEEKLFAYPDCS